MNFGTVDEDETFHAVAMRIYRNCIAVALSPIEMLHCMVPWVTSIVTKGSIEQYITVDAPARMLQAGFEWNRSKAH